MKCRITYREDGGVSVTPISEDTMEEFEVHYNKLLTNPMYVNSTYEDIDESELPVRDENRDKWRKNPTGGIMVDHTIVTPAELRQVDKDALDLERSKPAPDIKAALALVVKLQENNY